MVFLDIINGLLKKEVKLFAKFLSTPHSNSNKRLIILFGSLQKRKFNKVKIKKDEITIFKEIYGANANYEKKKAIFYNLKSNFHLALKQFIISNELKNSQTQEELIFINYLKRTNYKYFVKTSEALINKIEQKSHPSPQDYSMLFQLYSNLWFHPNNKQIGIERTSYFKALKNLDYAYLLNKLFFICEAIHRSNILQGNKLILFDKEILAYCKNNELVETNPLFGYYQQIIQFYSQPTFKFDNSFILLRDELIKNNHHINTEINIDLCLFLLSILQKLDTTGIQIDQRAEALKIYQFMVEEQLLPIHNSIKENDFLNIYILAISQGELPWALQFFEDYKEYLLIKDKIPFLAYCTAYGEFLLGNIFVVEAYLEKYFPLRKFHRLPIQNFQYYNKIKSLLIRNYYEQWTRGNELSFELLEKHISSFQRNLLRNQKQNVENITAFKNFNKLLLKIIDYRNLRNKDNLKLLEIRNIWNQRVPLVHKEWLKKIINAI